MTIRELPIACSLNGEQRTTREDDWRDLLEDALIERRPIPGGIALRLHGRPSAVSRLRELIELERQCCSWIDWEITEADPVVVEATSSREDGAPLLARWFGVSES